MGREFLRCGGGFQNFLTELECSGERLPRAAHRVSGSDLIYGINRILGIFDRRTGFSGWTGGGRIVSLVSLFSI